MAGQQAKEYQVIITEPGEIRLYEVVAYFYEQYSFERAWQLANELYEIPQILSFHPEKGSKEENLAHLNREYRYILFKRTKRAMIKIIYYVDKEAGIVYVTDFFPAEMDARRINKGRR